MRVEAGGIDGERGGRHDADMNGTGDPTSRDWERWRGEVTTTLAGLASQMSTVVTFVEEQKARNVASDAASQTRRRAWSWFAPSLPVLVSTVLSISALWLSLARVVQ